MCAFEAGRHLGCGSEPRSESCRGKECSEMRKAHTPAQSGKLPHWFSDKQNKQNLPMHTAVYDVNIQHTSSALS